MRQPRPRWEAGTAFEADELYQNVGGKNTSHRDPNDPSRRRAHKRKGPDTDAHDRPPISSVISRETGEACFWGGDHADTRTYRTLIAENIQLAARCCIPTYGRATGAAIQPMRLSVMVSTNGRGMMRVMADVKSIATPVKERERRFVRISGRSGASTSSTSICM